MNRAAVIALTIVSATAVAAADTDPPPTADPVEPVAGDAPPATSPADPAVTAAPTPIPAPVKRVVVVESIIYRSGTTFDLTVSGGLKLWSGHDDPNRWGFARVRVGVMRYAEPAFLMAGVAAQFGVLHSSSLGLEVEAANTEVGAWAQVGVFPIDTVSGTSIEAVLGYTLFGLEYQRRVSGDRSGDQALVLTLHVPLGLVNVMRKPPPGVTVYPSR